MNQLLTLKDFNGKVLLQYKRDRKGQLKGVVLATGAGAIGWSLCNKKDVFNKAKGISIALKRAEKMKTLSTIERLEYAESCPYTLDEIAVAISDRSYHYFKIPGTEMLEVTTVIGGETTVVNSSEQLHIVE